MKHEYRGNARRECTWNEDAPRSVAIGVSSFRSFLRGDDGGHERGIGRRWKKKRVGGRWWWSEVNGVARGWSGDRRRPPRGRAASSLVFTSFGSSAASAPPVSPKRFLNRESSRRLRAVPHRRVRFRWNASLKISCVKNRCVFGDYLGENFNKQMSIWNIL